MMSAEALASGVDEGLETPDGWPSVERDPPKALSAIRRAIWRLPEGAERRELERVSGNVRNGESVILARDAQGRTVGAAAYHTSASGGHWISNMAATGEVAGTGTALLRAVARVALEQEGRLELAPLKAARSFFLSRGGVMRKDAKGGVTIVWQGETLRRLVGGQGEIGP
jgi:hypothetical protein